MWKPALAIAVLLALHHGADAQQEQPHRININLHWISDSKGCKVWDSMPSPSESVTWTGPCKDGYADGTGTLTWYVNGSRHSTYQGELQGGHYAGRGTQLWPSGARYDGEWKNDRADGQGTYLSASGEVCAGAWLNGCFKGGACNHSVGAPQCPP